jgi:hypothetical protein
MSFVLAKLYIWTFFTQLLPYFAKRVTTQAQAPRVAVAASAQRLMLLVLVLVPSSGQTQSQRQDGSHSTLRNPAARCRLRRGDGATQQYSNMKINTSKPHRAMRMSTADEITYMNEPYAYACMPCNM